MWWVAVWCCRFSVLFSVLSSLRLSPHRLAMAQQRQYQSAQGQQQQSDQSNTISLQQPCDLVWRPFERKLIPSGALKGVPDGWVRWSEFPSLFNDLSTLHLSLHDSPNAPHAYYQGKFHPPQRPPHEIFNHPDKLMIAIGTPGVFHSAANEDTSAGKLYRLSRLYVCARCVLMADTKCNEAFDNFLQHPMSSVILLT